MEAVDYDDSECACRDQARDEWAYADDEIDRFNDEELAADLDATSRRKRRRRRRPRGPCSCPQCVMDAAADATDFYAEAYNAEGSHADMVGEALLDDGFAWFDHDAFDDEEDLDDLDDDEDDPADDDDLDDILDWFDGEDDDDLDDGEYDLDDIADEELATALDVTSRRKRRRRRPRGPCSCPQCAVDAEADADDLYNHDHDADSSHTDFPGDMLMNDEFARFDDDDLDDFDDDDLDEEDDLDDDLDWIDDQDDDDLDDDYDLDNFDDRGLGTDLDATSRRKRRGRRRRRPRGPCSCPQCAVDAEADATDFYDDADNAKCSHIGNVGGPLPGAGFAWFDHVDLDDDLDGLDDDEYDLEEDDLDDVLDWFDAEDDDNLEDDNDAFNHESDVDEQLDDENYNDEDDGHGFEVGSAYDVKQPVWRGFFSKDNRRDIIAGLEIAHCWADKALEEFDRIWNQKGRVRRRWLRRRIAWDNSRLVRSYFGWKYLTRGEIRRTRRRVRKIERILRERRIRFVRAPDDDKHCEGGSYAFVRAAGGIRRIHVCTRLLLETPEEMARTIIHELVHEIGFCHYSTGGRVRCTKGGAYSPKESRELARRHPTKARKNPQNYVHLFERLGRGC